MFNTKELLPHTPSLHDFGSLFSTQVVAYTAEFVANSIENLSLLSQYRQQMRVAD